MYEKLVIQKGNIMYIKNLVKTKRYHFTLRLFSPPIQEYSNLTEHALKEIKRNFIWLVRIFTNVSKQKCPHF